ncbi:MAG: sigma-70 family RNA polymerase sigma factor [Lachnospiraceae bacterium]|jgi:RNA polymerase sigma factor for flagellar operon FliA|nr:sigma-70 family RNA polymerase sigma factor [Lachnospiraceae bacterium]
MKMCKKQQQMLRQNKIMEHMNLIYYTLKHINIHIPSSMSQEDMVQYGCIGLIEAIDSYKEQKGKFSTYASIRIRGAMLDGIMEYHWLNRSQVRDIQKWKKAQEYLEEQKGTEAESGEIAEYLQLKPATEQAWQRLALTSVVYSESLTETERLCVQEESSIESWEEKRCLQLAFQKLDELERRLVLEYYFQQKSLKSFAKENQINPKRIYILHRRALNKLKKALEENV